MWTRSTSTFLNNSEIQHVLDAVRLVENKTSGEIRICIEKKCAYVDATDRARELFYQLQMQKTHHRNAVIIYIAYQDQDFAIYADIGAFKAIEPHFWQQAVRDLAKQFGSKNYLHGLIYCVEQIGNALSIHFPLQGEAKNELPDDIIFGN